MVTFERYSISYIGGTNNYYLPLNLFYFSKNVFDILMSLFPFVKKEILDLDEF